jgi:hypothetical protein
MDSFEMPGYQPGLPLLKASVFSAAKGLKITHG